jgi:hypothetical protein
MYSFECSRGEAERIARRLEAAQWEQRGLATYLQGDCLVSIYTDRGKARVIVRAGVLPDHYRDK